MAEQPRPGVLIAAGLDPSGGAGFLADARVIDGLGCRPVGVITAHTVQATTGVTAVHPVSAEVVHDQLGALLADVEVRAVKLGMLGNAAIAQAIGAALQQTHAPVVWDPILLPTRGQVALFDGEGVDDLGLAIRALLPHLTLVTPNAREATVLTGIDVVDATSAEAAARKLARLLRCAALVKGGHTGGAAAVDVLVLAADDVAIYLAAPRIAGGHDVHGTGCMLSSAIAAALALGEPLEAACRAGKARVVAALRAPVWPGRGAPAVL